MLDAFVTHKEDGPNLKLLIVADLIPKQNVFMTIDIVFPRHGKITKSVNFRCEAELSIADLKTAVDHANYIDLAVKKHDIDAMSFGEYSKKVLEEITTDRIYFDTAKPVKSITELPYVTTQTLIPALENYFEFAQSM